MEVVDHKLPSPLWDMLELGLEGAIDRVRPGSRLEARIDEHVLDPGLYYLWRPTL